MTTNIISGRLTHGVIAGEGNYGVHLQITAQGEINAPRYGIYAPTYISNVAVLNQGNVEGGEVGIDLEAFGTITNTGYIYGGAAGVALVSNGTLNNSGTISGGNVNYGAANAAVYIGDGIYAGKNSGLITGKDIGLDIQGDDLSNSGRIYGVLAGAALLGGSILNTGTISGETVALTTDGGTLNNAGLITSPTIAVLAFAGQVLNATGADISGNILGVGLVPTAATALTFTNEGVVTGGTAGVYLTASSLINLGTIENASIGVYLASGLVQNTGSIGGTSVGLYLEAGYASNSGDISGTMVGAYIYGGNLHNTGNLSGQSTGVTLQGGMLSNSGNITGGSIGVYASGGVIITTGTISGGQYAIYGKNAFALDISPGTSFNGALRDETGNGTLNLANGAPATLSGLGSSILGFNFFDLGFRNSWSIEGNVAGIASGQQFSLLPSAGITITGFAATYGRYSAQYGIRISNGAVDKVVEAYGVHQYAPVVYAYNGNTYIEYSQFRNPGFALRPGKESIINSPLNLEVTPGSANYTAGLTIGNNGLVYTSAAPAIYVPKYAAAATVTNNGIISTSGEIYDVSFGRSGTLINNGIIANTNDPSNMPAIKDIAGGMITNTGTTGGIFASGVAIYNSGSIATSGNFGVSLIKSSFLSTTGVIIGGKYGVRQQTYNKYQDTLINAGDIYGGQVGVADSTTLINTGSIGGGITGIYDVPEIFDSGTIYGGEQAVQLVEELNLSPGADFIGEVESADGTLSLAGTTAGSLDMGTSFSGFTAIEFAAGAAWSLKGAIDDLASGQTISGFTLGDTIVLDSFAATAHSFLAGSGLVLNSGATSEKLGFVTAPANYSIYTDGLNTTIAGNISIIKAPLTADLTPGSGGYARSLTITSTGTLTAPSGTAFYAAASISNAALSNAGTIAGLVEFENAANITNTGTIAGAFGLALHEGGNVTDSGTISGLFAAIENAAGILNLTLNPGAAFHGAVINTPGNGTLTLGGDTPGSINLGTSFTGFSNIEFTNTWTLEGARQGDCRRPDDLWLPIRRHPHARRLRRHLANTWRRWPHPKQRHGHRDPGHHRHFPILDHGQCQWRHGRYHERRVFLLRHPHLNAAW